MRKLLQFIRRIWLTARTRRELHALSDHMLRDIGLRREQIPYFDRRS